MGERSQTQSKTDVGDDDFFDPALADLIDDDIDELDGHAVTDDKYSLADKRRRAERRLEALRLREELGDYDFDFDDDF